MQTCSNCGVAVRPGAKFCTACGTRLNDVESNTGGASSWGVSTPVEDTPAATVPSEDDSTPEQPVVDERSETAPDATSTPSTAWTWGSTETDNPAERIPVTQTDNDSAASSSGIDDAAAPASGPASNQPFQWSWGSSSATETEETRGSGEPSTDETLSSQPADADGGNDDDTPQSAEVIVAPSADDDRAGREEREAELADAAPPYDWRQSVTYTYKEKSPTVDSSAVDMPAEDGSDAPASTLFADSDGYGSGMVDETGTTDAQTRAVELIDELRSLIPTLGATAAIASTDVAEPGGSVFDREGAIGDIVSDLERATNGIGTSDDLRAVLEAAQSRPRDMDVILDLVARAGSLIDLLDERDRLAAAIERAVSSLRS